jgi:hypothetical protein
MPAFAPQHHRAVTDGALGPVVSLSAAVAVRRATRTRAGELVEQNRGASHRGYPRPAGELSWCTPSPCVGRTWGWPSSREPLSWVDGKLAFVPCLVCRWNVGSAFRRRAASRRAIEPGGRARVASVGAGRGRGAALSLAGRLSWGRKAGLVNRASTRVFRAGGEEGCRHAVTRRRRRRRVRLPERRPLAAQRRHGREHLGGKRTPVLKPSRMWLPGRGTGAWSA